MQKIIFVCTGNILNLVEYICRSPTAHAVARHKAKIFGKENEFYFDSAGTTSYHAGEAPDKRSVAVGNKRGISFEGVFARQITKKDFENFDLIMCMDRSHLKHLRGLADEKYHHKIQLFLQFCAAKNFWDDEVVDPYYGGNQGFEVVYDVIEAAVENLLINFNSKAN